MSNPVLNIKNLVIRYGSNTHRSSCAVRNVSLKINKGESFGLVGESGCGKSSLAKAVMQFIKPATGQIMFDGENLYSLTKKQLRRIRPKFQMIFQDSISSFNPRRRVGAAVAMPLKQSGVLAKNELYNRVLTQLEQVGLDLTVLHLLPHQLSGGQCQRVQIARALITDPELLICDEPVSALDVSVQAQIINLLRMLRRDDRLAILFISHDLAVVKNICDRIAVMYEGTLCEVSPSEDLYHNPLHPYTSLLLSAIPTLSRPRQYPSFADSSRNMSCYRMDDGGCVFLNRCPKSTERCSVEEPELHEIMPHRFAACHYPLSYLK